MPSGTGLGGLGGAANASDIGGAPEIQNLPFDPNNPNRYYTIQMELLNRVLSPGYSVPAFSSDVILEVFRAGAGQIAMHYANDAIVSSAQLQLTQGGPALQYAAKFVFAENRLVKLWRPESISPQLTYTIRPTPRSAFA